MTDEPYRNRYINTATAIERQCLNCGRTMLAHTAYQRLCDGCGGAGRRVRSDYMEGKLREVRRREVGR